MDPPDLGSLESRYTTEFHELFNMGRRGSKSPALEPFGASRGDGCGQSAQRESEPRSLPAPGVPRTLRLGQANPRETTACLGQTSETPDFLPRGLGVDSGRRWHTPECVGSSFAAIFMPMPLPRKAPRASDCTHLFCRSSGTGTGVSVTAPAASRGRQVEGCGILSRKTAVVRVHVASIPGSRTSRASLCPGACRPSEMRVGSCRTPQISRCLRHESTVRPYGRAGYQNYVQGEWQVARKMLLCTSAILGSKEVPETAQRRQSSASASTYPIYIYLSIYLSIAISPHRATSSDNDEAHHHAIMLML